MPAERKNLKLCRACFHTAKPGKAFSLQSQSCLPDPETVEEMLLTVVPELKSNTIPDCVLCKDCLLKLRTSFRFRRMCVRNEIIQRAHAGKLTQRVIIKRAALLDHAYEREERKAEAESRLQQDVSALPTIIDVEAQTSQQEEVIIDNSDTFEIPIEPITMTTTHEYQQEFENAVRLNHIASKPDKPETKSSQIIEDLTTQPATTASISKLLCSKCPKVCSSYREAALHAQHEHNKKRTIFCKICKKFFTSTYLYKKHAKTHGFNVKNLIKIEPLKLECKECKTTFRKTHLYCKHMTEFHQKRFPKCYKCHKNCPNVRLLKRHISEHLRDGMKAKRSYLCDVCGKSFSVYTAYYSHKNTHIEEKKFNCALCEKKFTTKSLLRLHTETHTSEKRHMCEFCGMQFKCLQSLRAHKIRRHGDSPKVTHLNTAIAHNCPTCGKVFYHRSNLTSHLAIHKSLKAHTCEICGRGFTSTANLKRHVRLHTGEKPFVCVHCGRGFARIYALRDHQSVGEDNVQCKGLNISRECDFCKRKFQSKAALVKHLKVHNVGCMHKNDATCEICGRTVTHKSFLKSHMLTHIEKNYVCDVCGKRFKTNYGLSIHNRVHTGEKPFQCHLCGEDFISSGLLKLHQRKVHFVNGETATNDDIDEIQSGAVIQKTHSE